MNYIWEIALRAEECGYNRDSLFFKQAESKSPWYEQSFSCLNQKEIDDPIIEINTIVRFDSLFYCLLKPEVQVMPQFRAYLLDLAIHMLCEMDLQQGLTKYEFYIRRISLELLNGILGKQNAEDYKTFPSELRSRLAALVLSQLRTGSSLLLFRKAVLTICPDAMLYQMRKTPKYLLLYVKRQKTEQEERKIQFITETLLSIDYHIRIFWRNHFGVIEVDATMELDEIGIY